MIKFNVMLGHYFKKHFLETFYEKRKKKKTIVVFNSLLYSHEIGIKTFLK